MTIDPSRESTISTASSSTPAGHTASSAPPPFSSTAAPLGPFTSSTADIEYVLEVTGDYRGTDASGGPRHDLGDEKEIPR